MNKHLLKLSKLVRKSHIIGVFCIVFSLYGQQAAAQSLNISANNEPLENIFKMISRQSGYNFVYGDDYLQGTENVTLKMQNASLTAVLDACLKGTGLWYRIEGKEIIIVSPKFQQPGEQKASTLSLKGFVYNLKGAPLAGAAVILGDSRKGTVTDADGFFTMPIPADGATINISYLGMIPQSIFVKNQDEVTVKLQYDAKSIDNVVVTAYGIVQKKEDLVGSAYQVTSKQLETLPVTRVDRMLEGLVPGFSISSQSNMIVLG